MNATHPWSPPALARVVNLTRGTVLADRARHAATFWPRLLGLMGRAGLPQGEALIFTPCRGVHTHFMRFPIDLVFADALGDGTGRVVKVHEAMRPFRLDLTSSDLLIELAAGTLARTGTAVADRLDFQPEGHRP
jgi:uncharacterized membrane protein (UPF0127 family)